MHILQDLRANLESNLSESKRNICQFFSTVRLLAASMTIQQERWTVIRQSAERSKLTRIKLDQAIEVKMKEQPFLQILQKGC